VVARERSDGVGYDVELIQVAIGNECSFPITAEHFDRGEAGIEPFDSVEDICTSLLRLEGARPGPDETVDYLGQGLNHARFQVRPKAIHVENNLNAVELLKIYKHLLAICPRLLIHDLQSGQLHDAASFADWWTRPL
jgi:hypothetical protein